MNLLDNSLEKYHICKMYSCLQRFLPPLCFLDVPNGQEKIGAGGSFLNDNEAQIVADLIDILICSGLEASNIGVITLYKAQMYKVIQLIQGSG